MKTEILGQLNAKTAFITFEEDNADQTLFVAEYFSYNVVCKINIPEEFDSSDFLTSGSFSLTIQKEFYLGTMTNNTVEILPVLEVKGLAAVIKYVNSFIKLVPFKIVKHSRNQYQLLDPEGMDYIGEYVTFKDAKSTCFNNFLI